ncbi:trans-aconitate 2-methyltransferase [Aureimonas glaciei]|jgi:trans-aconitate 2-methyltransferase|uniref:Trans-aconitate 2-methyltransferase n=1 Tax=Aureimonas glaciei TaxID=1776957 RepID=A0A917DF09_9HYPH|nr:trans-aconitate 2-methyltransferase [Aureimonas glaciei]GGD32488.1 trans-aconitate 2-methyltransferase [Aureimonas glaciei]
MTSATTPTDWQPDLYRRFEDERTRPARDLLTRVPPAGVKRAVDIGCGPGNSTELLVERWPAADILGLDSSPAMIAAARQRLPALRFAEADVAAWTPDAPPDLIFANAVLQWVPDHAALLPRLFAALAPRGTLAIQMPDNLGEPSHVAMRDTAAEEDFAPHMGDVTQARTRLPSLDAYYDMLAATAVAVDVWRTTYHHPMDDAAAIVEWLKATGLRPFLDVLPEALRPLFLARYQARIDAAYPPRADGKRLLAFPRVFIVAMHKSG